ncbi:MAG: FtsX-like permease family protein [Cytophagales bacterium]|nr:FtsX-like permease family protein [Cytophagales bacterium]
MNHPHPPKLPRYILLICYGSASTEDLLGDMDELYESKRDKHGKFKANAFYWWQAITLCFSFTMVKRKRDEVISPLYTQNRSITMFYNYFKISYRNILKNRTFTLLNVFGLSLGMSIALLALAMYIELTQFDEYHQDAHQIYRITTTVDENGNLERYASNPIALADLCDEQLPDIEQSVHINDHFFPVAKTSGGTLNLSGYITSPEFFELFEFPMTEGNPRSLLEPDQTIITYELAEKLFGDKPAIDQLITTENWGTLKVSGVLAPFPKHTHFSFDLLTGYVNIDPIRKESRRWTAFRGNYYYFKSKSSSEEIEANIQQLAEQGTAFFEEDNEKVTHEIQSITTINPGPDLQDEVGVVFEGPVFFLFFGVALLILIPASLNYVNMAIANALKRSKEIGIRKVMGSQSNQIINQFLVETVLISLMALGFSILLFMAIRQEFLSMLVGADSLTLNPGWVTILTFVLFAVATGVITGLVPALFFSRTSPIEAIRQVMDAKKISISGARKGLLVFQFIISLGLMIGIGVLLRQYQHSLTYDLGFHKENILVVPLDPVNSEILKYEFMGLPEVTRMSLTSSIPGTPLSGNSYFFREDFLDSLRTRVVYVDDEFMDHMELKMTWGTTEMNNNQIDQIIVNQKLMSLLNNMNAESEDSLIVHLGHEEKVQIVGVVEDYNHEPLRDRIEPMIIRVNPSRTSHALISIATQQLPNTLSSLENRWDQVYPNSPFRSSFLDDEIEKTYDFFIVAFKLFGSLAVLAITISCLGLLGMVVYATENRIKEVAIRKILGADIVDLMKVLAGLFVRLWLIALCIAIPGSYFFYDQLFVSMFNKFSNGVGFIEILVSTLVTIALGTITIFWQTQRVVKTNPAVNLRNE